MKPIKISIFGADGYTCQMPRIKEAMQNLGNILSEDSPELIYSNDPTGYEKAMLLKKKFPNSYLILNFLDILSRGSTHLVLRTGSQFMVVSTPHC